MSHPVALQDLGCSNNTGTSCVQVSLLSHPSLVAQWLERLQGKRKVLGSIPGLGKHFSPKHDRSMFIAPGAAVIEKFVDDWPGFATKHACLVHMS